MRDTSKQPPTPHAEFWTSGGGLPDSGPLQVFLGAPVDALTAKPLGGLWAAALLVVSTASGLETDQVEALEELTLSRKQRVVASVDLEPSQDQNLRPHLKLPKAAGVAAVELDFTAASASLPISRVLALVRHQVFQARTTFQGPVWAKFPIGHEVPGIWLAQTAIESHVGAVCFAPSVSKWGSVDLTSMDVRAPWPGLDARSVQLVELNRSMDAMVRLRSEISCAQVVLGFDDVPPEAFGAAIAAGAFAVRLPRARTTPEHLAVVEEELSTSTRKAGVAAVAELQDLAQAPLRASITRVPPRKRNRPGMTGSFNTLPVPRATAVLMTGYPHGAQYGLEAMKLNSVECSGMVIAQRSFGHQNPAGPHAGFEAPHDVPVLLSPRLGPVRPFIEAIKPDFIICYHFPWKLPAEVLNLARLGGINIHPSLLPDYPGGQGGSSIGWGLRNGDEQLGVTVHRMTSDYDRGAILHQEAFANDETMRVWDASLAGERVGITAMTKAIAALLAGEPGRPQVGEGRPAPPFEPEFERLDWAKPAADLDRQVRACSQGAKAQVAGASLNVFRTRVKSRTGAASPPGTVLARLPTRLTVQCGSGELELLDFDVVG